MSILVCGGAGYIGSNTAISLNERGYDVVIADNLVKGHRAAVQPDMRFYEQDICDGEGMDRIFKENKIDAVVHFAAYSLVGESVADPMKYYENNLAGTMSLLKAMLKNDVNKIIFSSTASTYGEPERIPVDEKCATSPINPYGETKLAVEKLFKWYDSAYGLKSVCLRYFNVAGTHKSGKVGEDHRPESHLIPNILAIALGKGSVFKMFGTDYPTPDGTCIRDYIHVTDLADAHILSLEKLLKGGDSDVYNLGNGQGFSNKQILDAVIKVTGKDIKWEATDRRPGDPPVLIASSDKAMKELNWNPVNESLEYIIETAWKWHRDNPDGYKE